MAVKAGLGKTRKGGVQTPKSRGKRAAPKPDIVVASVLEALRTFSSKSPKLSVVAAVSGGLDSMVLLNALVRVREFLPGGCVIHVAHLNHGLRGKESQRDARFCRRAALKLGVAFHSRDLGSSAYRRRGRASIEMWAREVRHQFLAEVVRETGSKLVLLAHHADDQLELHLLRLARGTAGIGQSGMRGVARSPVDPSVTLLRPLLGLSRSQLADWARTHYVKWMEDSSNADLAIPRNRVRHRVVPELALAAQGDLAALAGRALGVSAGESDFVRCAAQEWSRHRQGQFDDLHPALQRQVIMLEFERLSLTPTFKLVEYFRQFPEIRRSVGRGGYLVRSKSGELTWESEKSKASPCPFLKKLDFEGSGGEWREAGVWVVWRRISTARGKQVLAGWNVEDGQLMDLERLGAGSVLRTNSPGDRMRPLGMAGSKKLQDIWVDRKFDRRSRFGALVLVAADGEIVWAEGAGISDRVKLRPSTRGAIQWRCGRKDSLLP